MYTREFERLLGGYFFTNAHEMVMVVREKMCWPPLALNPEYHDAETTPAVVRRRDRVPRYKREFERVSGAFFFTSTHDTQGQALSTTRQSLSQNEFKSYTHVCLYMRLILNAY